MFRESGMTIKLELGNGYNRFTPTLSHSDILQVTDAVHRNQSFIYLQLWALGRQADPGLLKKEGNYPYVSSSDVQMKAKKTAPRPLTKDEIAKYVGLYATAASNAIQAGFDGCEIHGANG